MAQDFIIHLVDRFPPWLTGLMLALATLSFLARHRAQYRYGRIREYQTGALAVAAALGALAAVYLMYSAGVLPYDVLRGAVRVLMFINGAAIVFFNWGGAARFLRDTDRTLRDLSERLRRRGRV